MAAVAAVSNDDPADVDAVLAAWRAWRPLAEEWKRLQIEADRIETTMPDWVRSGPDIRINDVDVHHPETLDRSLKQLPDWLKPASEQLRECALRGWNEGWARVEAERARLGLTSRQNRMDEIWGLEDRLMTQIEDANGSHPIIVAAKIDFALFKAPEHSLLEDVPWCMLSSAVRGLLQDLPTDMQSAIAPIAAMQGTVGQVYRRPAEEALS